MTLDQLQLAPHVRTNAEALQREFGEVVQFTSGYRNMLAQARAMAINTRHNPRWIAQTYTRVGRPSFAIGQQLQAWVTAHPEVRDVGVLTQAFFEQLNAMPNGYAISFHAYKIKGQPASLAFDLEPIEVDGTITAMGQEVWNRVLTLPYLDPPPLKREGGLVRWHVQFSPIVGSEEI